MQTVNEMYVYTHYWYQAKNPYILFIIKFIIFGLLKCSTLYSKLCLYIFFYTEINQKPFIPFICQVHVHVHYTNVWLWYYCTFSADSLPSKKFASFNILLAYKI